jgi:hypothetical protein
MMYVVKDNSPGQWYTCRIEDEETGEIVKQCVSHFEANNLIAVINEVEDIIEDVEGEMFCTVCGEWGDLRHFDVIDGELCCKPTVDSIDEGNELEPFATC